MQGDHVAFAGGCFDNGSYALWVPYQQDKLESIVPIEIRHESDPYTVLAWNHYDLGRDMTIAFWVSIASVIMALILTVCLGVTVTIYTRKPGDPNGPYI